MSKLPSMPFFPADFFADTAHLTRCAAHAYLFLLGHAWLRGAKLPNDDIALARMGGVRIDQWRKIKSEIMPFWKCNPDGYLTNSRLTAEWGYVDEKLTRLRENGALGGRPKSLNYNKWPKANGFSTETMAKAPIPTPIKEDSYLVDQGRKEASPNMNGQVFVKEDTEQWKAWAAHYRKSSGVGPPKTHRDEDRTAVGWWFPSEWPPKMSSPLRSV